MRGGEKKREGERGKEEERERKGNRERWRAREWEGGGQGEEKREEREEERAAKEMETALPLLALLPGSRQEEKSLVHTVCACSVFPGFLGIWKFPLKPALLY